MMYRSKKGSVGFVAISTMLIISAVAIAVVTTLSLLSIGEAQSSFSLTQGAISLQLVEGCAEDVLQKVHDNVNFNDTSISQPEGTCLLTYNSSGPTNWDVTVETGDTNSIRTLRITFTRGTTLAVTSWQE